MGLKWSVSGWMLWPALCALARVEIYYQGPFSALALSCSLCFCAFASIVPYRNFSTPPRLEVALVTLQQAGENNNNKNRILATDLLSWLLRQISWDDRGRNLTYELFHFYPPSLPTLAAVIYIYDGRLSFTVQGSRGTRVGGKSVAMERDPPREAVRCEF